MKSITRRSGSFAAVALCLSLAFGAAAVEESGERSNQETTMPEHASGTFDVKMTPCPPAQGEPEAIGRMVLDKAYQGDLDAIGQGQMLAFRTAVEGSAGYVAMERVEGALGGRSGSFVLQHSGIMDRGATELTLVVVPDSGTGELQGLSGSMQIVIEGGAHSYEFDYRLP